LRHGRPVPDHAQGHHREGIALEVIVGRDDLPADLAERCGWLNRALPPAELERDPQGLAARIVDRS
jgi:hypothetical protein